MTGMFTFGANGISDVVAFLYGLNAPPTVAVNAGSAGGTATIAVTPTAPGLNDLNVRSVDAAGNPGPIADYRFFVGSGAAPVALWGLTEGTGVTAADTGTGNHPLTLNSTTWTSGRVPGSHAVTFN